MGLWILAWFLMLTVPADVRADGCFVPSSAYERVLIPDQRALIRFADGVETLVIDTALKGDGTNYAWLVPVPSVPELEPATSGLFTTLHILFQPRIVHNVPGYYRWALIVGLVVAYVTWRMRRGLSAIGPAGFVAILAGLAYIALPGLSSASIATAEGRVSVLGRQHVGVYETATLRSPDGQAVFDWLQQNGFPVRTNFIPVIRAYCSEGWCFVASRVGTSTPMQQVGNVHPLLLRFRTDRAVYPLRLTGIENEPCRIDLYVFGPSRAEIPQFKVERCTAPVYPKSATRDYHSKLGGKLEIWHPLLRSLVAGSPAATKLSATLSSRQMGQDAFVTWTPMREQQTVRYSRQGAAILAANVAVPFLVLGGLGLLVSRDTKRRPGMKKGTLFCLCFIAGALIVGVAVYGCLPKTHVIVSSRPDATVVKCHLDIIEALTLQAQDRRRRAIHPFEEEVRWTRQRVADIISAQFQGAFEHLRTNVLTGDRLQEEDSPGNYTIRQTPDGVDYVWYDVEGAPVVMPLFFKPD